MDFIKKIHCSLVSEAFGSFFAEFVLNGGGLPLRESSSKNFRDSGTALSIVLINSSIPPLNGTGYENLKKMHVV